MKLFNAFNNRVEEVDQNPFKLEKDIQNLIEPNVESFFGIKFIQSEFSVDKYRVDTLCFNEETNAFVIIEYKKGSSYSVIDQGYTYLQLLLNNKPHFLLVLSQHYNKVMKFEEVDWSQSKIIFVSPSFNSYQKDSVNFRDLPFELWEIKRYANQSVILNQHHSSSKESIDVVSPASGKSVITEVSKEIPPTKTIEFHLSKSSAEVVQKWYELTEKFKELEDVRIESKNPYISLMFNGKTLGYFWFRKTMMKVELLRGNLNSDGTTSKGYFTIDDPKGIAKENQWEWKSGTKGTNYYIEVDKNTDLEYFMFLLKQKYRQMMR